MHDAMLDRRQNVPIIWGLLIKGKDASSSTTLENAKCEMLKRGLHYAINDVEMYP